MRKILSILLLVSFINGFSQGNYPWNDELILSTATSCAARTDLVADAMGKLYYTGSDGKIRNYWKDANGIWNENALNATMPAAYSSAGLVFEESQFPKLYYISSTNASIYQCVPNYGPWQINLTATAGAGYVAARPDSRLAITYVAGNPKIYYVALADNKIHYVTWNGTIWTSAILNNASMAVKGTSCISTDAAGKVYYVGTDNNIRAQTSGSDGVVAGGSQTARALSEIIIQENTGNAPNIFYIGTDNKVYRIKNIATPPAVMMQASVLNSSAPAVHTVSGFTLNNNQIFYKSAIGAQVLQAIYLSGSSWLLGTVTTTPPTFAGNSFLESRSGVSYYFDNTGKLHKLSENLIITNKTVGNGKKYEKFEIGVDIPTSIEQSIKDFVDNEKVGSSALSGSLNPYDQDQIKVKAIYTDAMENTYVRYGFFYRSAALDPASQHSYTKDGVTENRYYKYLINSGLETEPFRVRIAPEKAGNWTVNVELYINGVMVNSGSGSFVVDPSTRKGPLSLPDANKYLKDANQNNFFIVGQNTDCPWHWEDDTDNGGSQQHQYISVQSDPVDFKKVRGAITDLASKNANFVRLRATPHSYEMDGAFLFNQNLPQKTLKQCLNNYDARQHVAWELDKTIDVLEQNNVYSMFTLFYDPAFLYEPVATPPGINLDEWDYNPYSTYYESTLLPSASTTSDGQTIYSSNCSNHSNLQSSIEQFFGDYTSNTGNFKNVQNKLFYFMARWGYSPNIAMWQVMNETEFLGRIDETTPSIYTPGSTFKNNIDTWVNTVNNYMKSFYPSKLTMNGIGGGTDWETPPDQTGFNSDINASHPYTQNLWDTKATSDKEIAFKLAGKPYIADELGDIAHVDWRSDIMNHKIVWSGIFSGALGTPLCFWDQYQDNGVDHRTKLKNVADFMSGVDLNAGWTPANNQENFGHGTKRVETYYMTNGTNSLKAIGWVHNYSYNWYSYKLNLVPPISDPNDAFLNNYEPGDPINMSNPNNSIYASSGWYFQEFNDNIHLCPNDCPPYGPREENLNVISNTDHFIHVDNLFPNKSYILELYDTYVGVWGASKTILSDASGRAYFDINLYNSVNTTIGRYPDYAFRITPVPGYPERQSRIEIQSSEFNIYPNPATNLITITSETNINKIEVMNIAGQVLISETVNLNQHEVNLDKLSNGVYFVKVYNDNNSVNVKKIVVQK